MSNTRKQNTDTKVFRQDAFASAAEFERGILANLVAPRCQLLSDPNTISLLWWLQQISWRDGGLAAFACAFLESHAHLIGTRSMHKFGCAAGRVYSRDEVILVRKELYSGNPDTLGEFPLRDETRRHEFQHAQTLSWQIGETAAEEERAAVRARAARHPNSYPASAFLELCQIEPKKLADQLKRLMVDPKTDPEAGLWNMPRLLMGLAECREREIAQATPRTVQTDVTKKIADQLDFVLQQRAFVIIEGREGIGKTEGAEYWCARHPGRALYIKLESGTDEKTFFRCLAKHLGTACSSSVKPTEMRCRIEDALQPGHLVLVLDESHFLWPQSDRSHRTAPKRIDWIRTALVDHGVAMVLITTPQYFDTQCARFRKGGWNANQIQRRVSDTLTLPEQLDVKDVLEVARASFPKLAERSLMRVAALALGSVGYLTAIKHVRQKTDYLISCRPGAREGDIVEEILIARGIVPPAASPILSAPRGGLNEPLRHRPGRPNSDQPENAGAGGRLLHCATAKT